MQSGTPDQGSQFECTLNWFEKMVEPIRQLQASLAFLTAGLHDVLSPRASSDEPDSNADVIPIEAPSERRQLPPVVCELDKLKRQLSRSCDGLKSRCLALRLHTDRQLQQFHQGVQGLVQNRRRQANRPSSHTGRRRKTVHGLQLVASVESPAPAKSASSSASGVGASKNALAGGLAGGLVALSLYPVDTIKTLVQAETGAGQRSIPRIFQKLMEKHGEGL